MQLSLILTTAIHVLIYNCWDDGLGQTESSVLWFVGMNLSSKPQSLHYCQGYIFRGTEERNRGYALLMTANKPETVLYRAATFLFSLCHIVELVHVPYYKKIIAIYISTNVSIL